MISQSEARDIIISVIALSLALSIATHGIGIVTAPKTLIFFISFFAVTVGLGFVLHELAHKFVAMKFGAYAEFRMWPQGLFLALLCSLFGFVFAAPGAVYIFAQRISKAENGLISAAGPLTNLALFFLFIALGIIYPVSLVGITNIWGFAATINLSLGAFNMLPIFPLDGSKIWGWSKVIWGAMAALFLFLMFF